MPSLRVERPPKVDLVEIGIKIARKRTKDLIRSSHFYAKRNSQPQRYADRYYIITSTHPEICSTQTDIQIVGSSLGDRNDGMRSSLYLDESLLTLCCCILKEREGGWETDRDVDDAIADKKTG